MITDIDPLNKTILLQMLYIRNFPSSDEILYFHIQFLREVI